MAEQDHGSSLHKINADLLRMCFKSPFRNGARPNPPHAKLLGGGWKMLLLPCHDFWRKIIHLESYPLHLPAHSCAGPSNALLEPAMSAEQHVLAEIPRDKWMVIKTTVQTTRKPCQQTTEPSPGAFPNSFAVLSLSLGDHSKPWPAPIPPIPLRKPGPQHENRQALNSTAAEAESHEKATSQQRLGSTQGSCTAICCPLSCQCSAQGSSELCVKTFT